MGAKTTCNTQENGNGRQTTYNTQENGEMGAKTTYNTQGMGNGRQDYVQHAGEWEEILFGEIEMRALLSAGKADEGPVERLMPYNAILVSSLLQF